ncbi:MAG: hypothetical protein ACTHW2_08155 [Tissierella sp.]|uniref:hypothetical protein n=1 Tax=Tissierella sp. TaxID=41274 RepID=UPI003F9C834C
MNFLEDIIYVNRSALDKTLKNFTKNWMIIFTGIVYIMINLFVYNLLDILFVGPLSILSGIILALFKSSIVSNYLYLLFNIVNYNRLTTNNFKEGFTHYVRKIYGVFFVAYLGRLLLSLVLPGLGQLGSIINLVIFIGLPIALNALSETIYLKQYDAWESIIYSLEFLKDNFINWTLPNIIFYAAIYAISGQLLLNVFNTNIGFNFSSNIVVVIIYIISQTIFSFMMIYRGHLYKILSTSTRRKRTFMKKI